MDFILKQIPLSQDSRILDMCCGYGRHAIEFASRGYNVKGIDYSNVLLAHAKQNIRPEFQKNIKFEQMDLREFNEKATYQLLINLYISFGYFSDQENERAFQAMASSLAIGGYLLMEVNNYHKIVGQKSHDETKMLGSKTLIIDRSYDNATKRTIIHRIIQDKNNQKQSYVMDNRIYSLEELVALGKQAGLSCLKSFGDYDGSKFNWQSEKLIVLFKKIKGEYYVGQ